MITKGAVTFIILLILLAVLGHQAGTWHNDMVTLGNGVTSLFTGSP